MFPIHDFANYYFSSHLLIDGNLDSTIYFPFEFNKEIFNLGIQGCYVSYAPNTPFLSILFLPLTIVPVLKAKLIFNIISSFLYIYSCYRLIDFYKINNKFIILIPLIFLIPIKNNLLFGQVYFFLLFLLSECLIAYEKQNIKRTALFLSLSVFLKVFPFLLICIFIFRKQWKYFFYTIFFCFIFLILSICITGVDIWFFFFKTILPKASNGEIANSFVDNYQSLFMFLKRIFVFDSVENKNVVYNNPILFKSLILGIKIFVISIGFYITTNIKNNLFIFSFWTLISIILTPYGSTYGYIVLIFTSINILKVEISKTRKVLLFLILFLINNFPISFFIENRFPFSYLRLFGFLILFLMIIFLYSKIINWNKALVISLFSTLVIFFTKPQKTISSLATKESQPILVYDYKLENSQLTYFYWNERGENSKKIFFKNKKREQLLLLNNQIYYRGKQITFDKSYKLKPTLIDDKTIIYLSDFDKGIGFYSLRKFELN